jgi:hypothetical protein
MVAHFSNSSTSRCPAQQLNPAQRQQLAIRVLSGHASARQTARDLQVSRRFVARQTARAQNALQQAFTPPPPPDERVLFHLPVTANWIRSAVLGLSLICHSSVRGVVEFFRDLLDYPVSVGSVHDILHAALPAARAQTAAVDLSAVRIPAFDEIFQAGEPILVGVDADSTYCCLLSPEQHRDADTWGVRLLELADQGLDPEASIADLGSGLRAGHAEAFPDVPCRADIFHVLRDFAAVVRTLEAHAYRLLRRHGDLDQRLASFRRKKGRPNFSWSGQRAHVVHQEHAAIQRADDVRLLFAWLRDDVLAVSGLSLADRQVLFDFLVAELQQRAEADDVAALAKSLAKNRASILAFAAALDQEIAALAERFGLAPAVVGAVLDHLAGRPDQAAYWQREAQLHHSCQGRLHEVRAAVQQVRRQTVRASSVVENVNSRLRSYIFLRRHMGADALALLQFFLNHRRLMRSDRAERVGQSPRELLTQQRHGHWLELLGCTRFHRT